MNMKTKTTRGRKDEKETCQVLEELKQKNLAIDPLKQSFFNFGCTLKSPKNKDKETSP